MKSEVKRLPELFLDRLRQLIPSQKWDAVANTFAQTRPTTFRVNTLKSGVAAVRERLEHSGFHVEKVGWYPEAFILKRGSLRELQKTPIYESGGIYVQSLSSMLPPLILDAQPGERVLDLTAAPGSKTTQLAAMMKGEGKIVANDNNKIRFFKLKANVELQGARNVELSLKGGEIFGRDYPESFDRVLLDAPCSAEGRFNAHEPSSYRYWKLAKIKEMARKQKMLFASAFRALRPGGLLVYSTCTFAPEENEGVLNWALRKFENKMQLEKTVSSAVDPRGGITHWQDEVFDPSVRQAMRVLPNDTLEGFFIAKCRKL